MGIMGIGEAAVLTMLFLELQRHPKVATNTGMYVNILTSGGFALAFAIEGYFDDFYYLVFFIIAVPACIFGMFLHDLIFKKVSKHYITIMFFFIGTM
jgi:uncharacterized membrane protein YfcA